MAKPMLGVKVTEQPWSRHFKFAQMTFRLPICGSASMWSVNILFYCHAMHLAFWNWDAREMQMRAACCKSHLHLSLCPQIQWDSSSQTLRCSHFCFKLTSHGLYRDVVYWNLNIYFRWRLRHMTLHEICCMRLVYKQGVLSVIASCRKLSCQVPVFIRASRKWICFEL